MSNSQINPKGSVEVRRALANARRETITLNRMISSPNADLSYSGEEAFMDIDAGQTVAFGSLLCMAADFELELADANAATTVPGMFLGTGAGTGSQLVILPDQYVRNDAWSWAAGLIFADLTAGGMTQDLSSHTTGDYVQVVAVATTATIIYFSPSISMVKKL